MLSFDDPRWHELRGGYRVLFDPRPLLLKLQQQASQADWALLCEGLYHQGDVDYASYAAVPSIVDIVIHCAVLYPAALSLIVAIETARHSKHNPPLPLWLEADYKNALRQLMAEILRRFEQLNDPAQIRSAIAVLAAAKGQTHCAYTVAFYTEQELIDLLQF